MLTDNQVLSAIERMPADMRVLFEVLPTHLQEKYLVFWEARPDPHAAHRDTLPAFIAGVFANMR